MQAHSDLYHSALLHDAPVYGGLSTSPHCDQVLANQSFHTDVYPTPTVLWGILSVHLSLNTCD